MIKILFLADRQFDPYQCIDLDPEVLYQEGIEVKDPLGKVA